MPTLMLGLSLTSIVGRVDYNPITILGSDLLAWWTADDASSLTLVGSAVSAWRDQVAGYEVTQGTSSARPQYSATSFGGSPGISFDGTDDELTLASMPFPSGSVGSELFAIAQQNALPADTGFRCIVAYGGDFGSGQRRVRRTVASGVNRGQLECGTGSGTFVSAANAVDLSSRHLMRAAFGPEASAYSTDGNSPGSSAGVPATGTERLRIGSFANVAAGQFWSGPVRDILVTNPLNSEQYTALQAWALPRRNI